jgi:hypothetical protein
MSKIVKRTGKEQKEGTLISLKEAKEPMERYRMKTKENVNFEIKYFFISISILLSTNIYIHKNVKYKFY